MRILVVEDDAALCSAIRFHLEREGYEADECQDGESALHLIRQQAYDLIILDRMLPSLGGIEVLAQLRHEGISCHVLIVTALGGVNERVAGLDAGADDYLVKPFATEELLARVRSLLRRAPQLEALSGLAVGDAALDGARHLLRGPKGSVSLSRRETQLFEVFFRNPQQILPRPVLFSKVWGPDAPVEDGNLDTYIHFLRQKLRQCGSALQIKTVHSVGYRLLSGEGK